MDDLAAFESALLELGPRGVAPGILPPCTPRRAAGRFRAGAIRAAASSPATCSSSAPTGSGDIVPFTASESPQQQNQSDDGSVDVACIGCHRSRENGTCYIVPSEDIQWALPDNRGLWCKDCFCCWRTCFSQSHSLTLFAVWLKSPVNEQAFESRLVAFLSLKTEGDDRITACMVSDRP